MSTINISLPKEQVSLIDQLVEKFSFANRSEFIRSIIRLIMHKEEIVSEAATFPFVVPKNKSAKKIVNAFKNTKKYSKEFLKDLKEGLRVSDYFQR
jgi:Arc/MetJ-type ribon-helix-helix transcriptional regulator